MNFFIKMCTAVRPKKRDTKVLDEALKNFNKACESAKQSAEALKTVAQEGKKICPTEEESAIMQGVIKRASQKKDTTAIRLKPIEG
jgi:hypothetical protein